ncbi:MAG: DNA recombination protein RmuC [Clostridia bacterium]|nr:DNA recombination protein RmuC [Clostridia bacterium]
MEPTTILLILAILILLALIAVIVLVAIPRRPKGLETMERELRRDLETFGDRITDNQHDANMLQEQRFAGFERANEGRLNTVQTAVQEMSRTVAASQQSAAQAQEKRFASFEQTNEQRFASFEQANEQKLEQIRQTVERRLSAIQQENGERLDKMQQIVDEKLQKTLETRIGESFKLVSNQLEQVYKGLGEMQSVAAGVTDLKKVLSNVKTRGILGEVQLGAILSEILSPEQFDTNVATKAGSRDVVEYAIKMPGEGDGVVYLPIDAKFPGETYAKLLDAYDSGSAQELDAAVAALKLRLKGEAKDIRQKYIDPPNTTDFAILFLPFEGLYAEAVNRGMVEELQRLYRVNIAGPSTMAALLNSLQMGFRTLAIQKRSSEVWQVLGAVKTEFEKFGETLEKSQQRLQQVNSDLDSLIGTRSRAIARKLRAVEKLDPEESERLLQDGKDA